MEALDLGDLRLAELAVGQEHHQQHRTAAERGERVLLAPPSEGSSRSGACWPTLTSVDSGERSHQTTLPGDRRPRTRGTATATSDAGRHRRVARIIAKIVTPRSPFGRRHRRALESRDAPPVRRRERARGRPRGACAATCTSTRSWPTPSTGRPRAWRRSWRARGLEVRDGGGGHGRAWPRARGRGPRPCCCAWTWTPCPSRSRATAPYASQVPGRDARLRPRRPRGHRGRGGRAPARRPQLPGTRARAVPARGGGRRRRPGA